MQHDHLYVFDPLALHHILIKDQDIYEETVYFRSSVFRLLTLCIPLMNIIYTVFAPSCLEGVCFHRQVKELSLQLSH